MNYNELTWRHFGQPRHAGRLVGADVRSGTAGDRTQGTWVRFDVRLSAGGDRIEAAAFQAFGCPHVIAAADWVCGSAIGTAAAMRLPEAIPSIRKRFEVPIEKTGRLLLIEDAWFAALAPPCGGMGAK